MKRLSSLLLLFCLSSAPFALEGKFRGLPAISSSAETGTQVGGLLMYFMKPEPQDKYISNIGFAVLASFKNQWKIDLFPDLYLTNTDHINLNFTFTYWPTYFYGIGNDTQEEDLLNLTSKGFHYSALYEKHLFDTWWIGAQMNAGGESIEWQDQEFADEFLNLRGQDGSIDVGVGLVTSVDFRDHHNAPRKGTKLSFSQFIYPEAMGSSSTFYSGSSQVLGFWSPYGSHVLAASTLTQWVLGEAPFRSLVSPDGAKTLRGVVKGRFRDRRHLAFNTEYRTPFYKDFGLVFFTDWSQVAPEWNELKADAFHYSPGVGVRYAFNRDDRYHVRLDVSFLDGKEMQMTIYVKEAF